MCNKIIIIGKDSILNNYILDFVRKKFAFPIKLYSEKEFLENIVGLDAFMLIIDCYTVSNLFKVLSQIFQLNFFNVLLINCFPRNKKQWENMCYRKNIKGCLYPDLTEKKLEYAIFVVYNLGIFFENITIRENKVRRNRRNIDKLTNREIEILYYLKLRFTNKMIANILNISQNTVNVHVSKILQKKSLKSRYDLIFENDEA